MVWAVIKIDFRSPIVFLKCKINANKYQDCLETHLLPFITISEDENFKFQQDNAPIHTARSTEQWLNDYGISCIEWPALSPDLNPIENVWGLLARRVYDKSKPMLNSVAELESRVKEAWDSIPTGTINRVIESFPSRLLEVLKKNGNMTKY